MATNYLINGSEFSNNFIPKEAFTSGNLWNWGFNSSGALGDNTTANKSSPVQTVVTATNWNFCTAGGYHSAAVKTDGTLWLWGKNDYGQLGDGTTTSTNTGRSSPVQTVSTGTTWKMVSSGGYGDCTAAIKSDGTLWSWGRNQYGQLGDSTTTSRSSPVQIAGTNWKIIDCGGHAMGAIKTDGTLWTWGYNGYGGLGDSTSTSRSSPVQIAGTNWKTLAVSVYLETSTGAIKTDGSLWTWGRNNYGQLGDGTTTDRSSPTQISGTWKQISTGFSYNSGYMSAIKTDGSLWSWGRNNFGQFGDGTGTSSSSPVQTISGGNNWKMVSAGCEFTGAIKTDGTLWMWGKNYVGSLGDGTTGHKSSPVQIAGTNWKIVHCGSSHAIAVRDNS